MHCQATFCVYEILVFVGVGSLLLLGDECSVWRMYVHDCGVRGLGRVLQKTRLLSDDVMVRFHMSDS
jgi:hypothetical protein